MTLLKSCWRKDLFLAVEEHSLAASSLDFADFCLRSSSKIIREQFRVYRLGKDHFEE